MLGAWPGFGEYPQVYERAVRNAARQVHVCADAYVLHITIAHSYSENKGHPRLTISTLASTVRENHASTWSEKHLSRAIRPCLNLILYCYDNAQATFHVEFCYNDVILYKFICNFLHSVEFFD